jgi:hypothetical protein
MAHLVVTSARVIAGSIDISGDLNQVSLTHQAPDKPDTSFGSTAITRLPGLLESGIDMQGFYDAGTGEIDPLAGFSAVGAAAATPVTVIPEGCSLGAYTGGTVLTKRAFFLNARVLSAVPGLTIGEVAGFSVNGKSTGPLVAGPLMVAGQVSTTGGSDYKLYQAVASGQKMYIAVHVLSGSGSLDVQLLSDDTVGFGSFTSQYAKSFAAAGSDFASVDGPITDTYWQFYYTVNSGGPFVVVASIGVQQ